jgi:hypothetical protein
LKFLDVVADVDFDIDLTDTQANPSDFVGGSISLSTSFVGNGLIYVDDEAINEYTSILFFLNQVIISPIWRAIVMATFMFSNYVNFIFTTKLQLSSILAYGTSIP